MDCVSDPLLRTSSATRYTPAFVAPASAGLLPPRTANSWRRADAADTREGAERRIGETYQFLPFSLSRMLAVFAIRVRQRGFFDGATA